MIKILIILFVLIIESTAEIHFIEDKVIYKGFKTAVSNDEFVLTSYLTGSARIKGISEKRSVFISDVGVFFSITSKRGKGAHYFGLPVKTYRNLKLFIMTDSPRLALTEHIEIYRLGSKVILKIDGTDHGVTEDMIKHLKTQFKRYDENFEDTQKKWNTLVKSLMSLVKE